MKTNVTMTRKMGNFDVFQRTSDGMFNATALLKQWNAFNNSNKELKEYFKLNSTNDFASTIAKRENLNGGKSTYLTTRGKYNGGTWMHPMLFIDFCMWINPSFKYDVLKFVYDQMIKYRNDAGDAYRDLSSSIQKIVPTDFMRNAMQKVGEAINWVVFNEHEHGMRNKVGDENKQRELYELEHKVSDLINDGFIKTYEGVINYLRNQYAKHNYPAIFLNKQLTMTRRDAQMIAEELYKLMQLDDVEYMNFKQASEYIKHSVSYLKQHKEIPRCKVGGRILFTKQQLTNWAVR